MKILKTCLFILTFFSTVSSFAQNKILFDASKAEMAGSADWIIDTDLFNINFTSSGTLVLSGGNESNPQKIPTPAQSGISSSTTESYWDGAISAWAVDCVKQGYVVETLPYNGAITYGNSSNLQDLSNYKVFVVPEPNILFTAAEKTAIMNFISNGGGLFLISDHAGADRNNDGFDSPMVWNDFMSTNSVQNNPFGIQFNLVGSPNGISETTSKVANLPTDPILHGIAGNVTKLKFSGGDSMTLNTSQNPNTKGLIYKNSSTNSGLTNVFCASTTFNSGKVVAIGDSSPFDDNTGDPNDTLYDGYNDPTMAGNHQNLIMNATIWLMTSNTAATNENSLDATHFTIAPNPSQDKQIHFTFSSEENQNTVITIFDTLGRIVKEVQINEFNTGVNYQTIDARNLENGVYICKLTNGSNSKSLQLIIK
ncbi:T9SS type A sorting domain-containing protein [Flavobacterium sp.]|jgi:hypothetical protein|uniref:T9SS type A sorting domain-containing protein n=1 Tax=Flavobacterium sp. TaxID=239 RepID=UPI0037C1289B